MVVAVDMEEWQGRSRMTLSCRLAPDFKTYSRFCHDNGKGIRILAATTFKAW